MAGNGTGGRRHLPFPESLPVERVGKSALRKTLRARRRALPGIARRRAAEAVAHRLARLPEYRRARHVAAYLPFDGELDARPLLAMARDDGKQVYVPVIRPHASAMHFVPLTGPTRRRNRLGIVEPGLPRGPRRPAFAMDLVLAPLVAFDHAGYRLGMGGGYYDRCFRFLRHRPRAHVRLAGVAYAFQEVESLPVRAWDVPLSLVVTDRGVHRYPARGRRAQDTRSEDRCVTG